MSSVYCHTLAAENDWDSVSFQEFLFIAENTKAKLAMQIEIKSLEALILLAMRLDNCIRERCRDHLQAQAPLYQLKHSIRTGPDPFTSPHSPHKFSCPCLLIPQVDWTNSSVSSCPQPSQLFQLPTMSSLK